MNPKPTDGGRRAHITLDQTRDAGRTHCRGQECQCPSEQWQSGEYDHTCFGAAVWVSCSPLEDLIDYLLNLMGLGGKCISLLAFVILCMQVQGIAGYDEDTVFLVVSDESEFGWRVPLVVGTCNIGRMINVIRENEGRRQKADHRNPNHFSRDSTSFMLIPAQRTAGERCLW